MIYFLDNKIVPINSGIEHAIAKRLKLFKQFGYQAKIVTNEFQLKGHSYLKYLGLADQDTVNFYDFFGESEQVENREVTLDDLHIPAEYVVKSVKGGYEAFGDNRKKLLVHFEGSTSRISDIWYLDKWGKPLRKEYFDVRGFKSTALRFGFNGHRTVQELYTPSGRLYGERYFARDNQDKEYLRAIRLVDYNGSSYTFDDLTQALTFFYDELNKSTGVQNIFISDRSNITNEPMTKMQTKAIKLEQFHSKHFKDWQDPSSESGYPSIELPERLQHTSGIVVPTQWQKEEMGERIGNSVPIFAIPVGVVTDEDLQQMHIPMNKRQAGKIIAVARPAVQKHLSHAIKAVAKAREVFPDLTFDILGTPAGVEGPAEENRLKKLVEDNGWNDFINFRGYVTSIQDEYQSAQLSLLTSRWEGFGLAMLESIANGVPVISYDFRYGAREVISNGVNGYLVDQLDFDTLVKRIIEYFSNERAMQEMSDKAYASANNFSADKIWKKWQKTFVKVNPV